MLTVLFVILISVIGSLYQMMLQTMHQEIKGVNETAANEIMNRMDEVLKKSKEIAIEVSVSDYAQLYFIYPKPEYLMKDFAIGLNRKLNIQGLSCIDSVILYAPEYERMYDSKTGLEYYMSEIEENSKGSAIPDISWMEKYDDSEASSGIYFTRARADQWPYYLTYMLPWQSGTKTGFILVNIDLEKLYDYLLMGRNESIHLYVVDNKQRVFLQERMNQLYTKQQDVKELESFRSNETYSELNKAKNQTYIYVQRYMEDYDFNSIIISYVGDYYTRLTQLQARIFRTIFLVTIITIILACIYSIKLVKPHKDNVVLRQELKQRQDLLRNTQLLALQTQINPHFMFNTLNIAILMLESMWEDHPVSQILSGMSDILRYSLSKSTNVNVKEEVACAQKYIFIMKHRYGDFKSIIDVDEEIEDCVIPKLILQPLIENSLQHGISPSLGIRSGSIKVQISELLYTYKNGKELVSICIDVIDNGVGIDEEKLENIRETMSDHHTPIKEHIGLFNVAERFYLLFHEEQEVTIESEFGKGTHVRLVFPFQEEPENSEGSRECKL